MALRFFHYLTIGLVTLTLLFYASYYTSDVNSSPRPSPQLTAAALAVMVTDVNLNLTSGSMALNESPKTNTDITRVEFIEDKVNTTTKNETKPLSTMISKTPNNESSKLHKSNPNDTVKWDPSIMMTSSVYVAGHSIPHPELCPSLGDGLKVMIFIMSAPSHLEARTAIRLTWGHFGARKDISMAFFIGYTSDTKISNSLDSEDDLYGDVIKGNFLDSYSNLTLKTISMLEWVDNYCPNVKKVLKTDDDMFINVPQVLKFIETKATKPRSIYGKLVKKSPPKRTTKSKYYVSPKQFAPKIFPDFTTGPCYLMSTDCVRDLYERSLTQPYVRLEDVYITGIIATQLNISRNHAGEFYNKKVALHPCNVQRGISIHMVRFSEQFDLWKKLLDGKNKCSKT